MATTNSSGALTSSRGYRAYGNYRRGGEPPTDYRFTGQQQDASGLVYMNARYYDPMLGQFISPDTLVPGPGMLVDYNRYGYARGATRSSTMIREGIVPHSAAARRTWTATTSAGNWPIRFTA